MQLEETSRVVTGRKSQRKNLPQGAWVQEWEESERGWGVRPDGCFFYATEAEAKRETQRHLAIMRNEEAKIYKGATPDEYSRPSGEPRFVPVSETIVKEIERNGYAYRSRLSQAKPEDAITKG